MPNKRTRKASLSLSKGRKTRSCRKAAEHFAKFRARCPQEGCHTIFCAGCQAEPYHLGYTCEEYKNYQSARKCRYCKEKIEGEGASTLPVFRNVCRKPECVALMGKACDKLLPCGHPCYGTNSCGSEIFRIPRRKALSALSQRGMRKKELRLNKRTKGR